MSTNRAHYMIQGTLRVAARGFWYSRGGEKGSFGHCAHLKDDAGHPIYPDTQIHGDLRLAARWARTLGVPCPDGLFERIFGREGSSTAALLHVGDLTLAAADRPKWAPGRFQVKPRIEIDDTTRSVRDRMLVSFEVAWLDGLYLEAPLYAGYFETRDEATAARALLTEAAGLVSGFGAFRSRGFGRGEVHVAWDEPEALVLSVGPVPADRVLYRLEGLVNIRSKPVAAERLQLVCAALEIAAGQVRGWFIRAFRALTGRWPDAGEAAGITFSDFYPSGTDRALCYPPPMTTLRKEDGSAIDDYWERPSERDDNHENFAQCKLKPLRRGEFVTADGRVVETRPVARMRNAVGDDFRTLDEGGLFMQQYLPRGTIYGGTVHIHDPAGDFGRMAYAILGAVKPTINGCLFSPSLEPAPVAPPETGKPMLVVSPIPYDPERIRPAGGHGMILDTQRRYNAVLGRPRRGRAVVAPGSVLPGPLADATLCWTGFGQGLHAVEPPGGTMSVPARPIIPAPLEGIRDWKRITRAQAGILREMLHPAHDEAALKRHLAELERKHREKGNVDFVLLYSDLYNRLEMEKREGFAKRVRMVLEYLQTEVWWRGQKTKAKGERGR